MKTYSSVLRVTCFLLCLLHVCNASIGRQTVLGPPNSNRKRPNIIFVLTDDQDLHMDSLSYMPLLQKHLIKQGTFYKRHYCTIALCCPSRVSLWTGLAAHNTNVTDVNPPYGGYPKFISQGLNSAYLPVWLQQEGYNTYYTGKLFNAHTVDNYDSPYPAGFTGTDFLLDPYTYEYENAHFQRNQDPPKSYQGQYSTDVLAEKAYGYLRDGVEADEPFFLTIAPVAPHSNVRFASNMLNGSFDPGTVELSPPISAERHKHLFEDAVVPRNANFNPEKPSGVNWISKLPRLNQTNIDFNDLFYRSRLRALQAVDEIIEGVINRLDDYGILDNTYIIYTSDNGYHVSQHRLQPGKECGFEEDINIPLVIRGPNVPKGKVSEIVTTHTDLVPTIFDLIGLEPRETFDGSAIPVTAQALEQAKGSRHEHVNVEYWGFALAEGKYGKEIYWNNTYKSLRLVSRGYNLYYSIWCNNEHELYDLNTDPYQVNNIFPSSTSFSTFSPASLLGYPLDRVVARLDALVMILKSCKGKACVQPWTELHPEGNVKDLWDALHVQYNEFYEEQRKVAFTRCEKGYIIDAEGPQEALVYRGGVEWSEFV